VGRIDLAAIEAIEARAVDCPAMATATAAAAAAATTTASL